MCPFFNTLDRSVAGGSTCIQFSSTSNEGALLVLPEGADQHDLCNLLLFEREALRNGRSWYEFAVTKLGRTRIAADSLYLITGCHKTSSWSLAAFHQSSGNCNFNAQFTAGKIINGNIGAAYSWQMTSAVPCRIGPEPYDDAKNQTVFIRGFKIAIRSSTFLSLLRGDVTVSYKQPNTAPRQGLFSQRPKGWPSLSMSNNETHQTEGATNPAPVESNLDLGAPYRVKLWTATESVEECEEDRLSSASDISLFQSPPITKVYIATILFSAGLILYNRSTIHQIR